MLSFQNPVDALEISGCSINMSFSFPVNSQGIVKIQRIELVFSYIMLCLYKALHLL